MEATETKRNGIAMTHGRESCSRPLWRKPGCDFAVTANSQFKGKARQGKAVLFITQAFHVTRVYTLSVRIMLCACLISISTTQDELHDSALSCSS